MNCGVPGEWSTIVYYWYRNGRLETSGSSYTIKDLKREQNGELVYCRYGIKGSKYSGVSNYLTITVHCK